MEDRLTVGVLATGRLHSAWIDTFAVIAGAVERAVRVAPAASDARAVVADLARVAGRIAVALLLQ